MSRSSVRATALGTMAIFLIFGGLAVAAPVRSTLHLPPPALASRTPAPQTQPTSGAKASSPGVAASRAPSGFAELLSPGPLAGIVRAGGSDGGGAVGAAPSPAPSPASLLDLANLKPGDAITITRPDHSTVTYRVTTIEPPLPSASAGQGPALLTPQPLTTPQLQLIGAGGSVGPVIPPATVVIPGLLSPSPSP